MNGLPAALGAEFLDGETMMRGDRLEHASEQRAEFQRLVVRHGDVMSAVDLSRQPEVQAVLPHSLVA